MYKIELTDAECLNLRGWLLRLAKIKIEGDTWSTKAMIRLEKKIERIVNKQDKMNELE